MSINALDVPGAAPVMTVAKNAGAAIKQTPNTMNKAELTQSNDVVNFNFNLPWKDAVRGKAP